MTIRPFSARDLPAVLEIYALAKLDELANESSVPPLIPLQLDHARYATFQRSTVYVYEDTAQLGYAAHAGAEVTAIFVHPSSRGKGIGRMLLEHLLVCCPGPSHLQVVASNAAAVSLYSKYGFEVRETFEASYNGQPVLAATMYQKVGAPSCTAVAPNNSSKPTPLRGAA